MKFWNKPFGEPKPSTVKGKIHIIASRCKGCGFCIEYCPTKTLEFSADFNEKGYHPPRVINEETCVACGFCDFICPDFAIFVTDEAKGRKEDILVQEK